MPAAPPYRKKLIEVALPLAAINREAAREKSIRHGHPSTLHLWWARRPLAAARAVLWASLVDDPSAHPDRFPTPEAQERERRRLFGILERLVPWEASTDRRILEEARVEILASCDGELPTICDPFAGGGTIPLEAVRLGLPTVAGDLNPVAVLIQKAMLEIPARFAGQPPVHPEARTTQSVWEGTRGLAADVEAYGEWMRERAKERIGRYYPDVRLPDGSTATPIAWIWARTVRSPDPSWPGHVPLVRSWVLAKRPGKPAVWVEPIVNHATRTIRYEIRSGRRAGDAPEPTVERGNGRCIATGVPIPGDYIKAEANAGRMGATLLAVVAEGQRERVYVAPTEAQVEAVRVPDPAWLPTERVPIPNHDVDRLPMYGMPRWGDAFTPRQMLALTTFSDLLGEVRGRVVADAVAAGLADDGVRLRDGGTGSTARADAVVTYLALVVDRCADYWSMISTWVSAAEYIAHTFTRQAIPMTWDFAEGNPFSDSTGNWSAMVDWVAKAVQALPAGRASVAQRDASARLVEAGPAVVATDPPYYDNISYADLSDFFYVWLRRNLRDVWPDECATLLTPKTEELIANPYRAGSKQAALAHFEAGMQQVLATAARHADPRYPATIFYAFKATETTGDGGVVSTGWETFLSGLLEAGFAITATWPLRTERGGRLLSLHTNALASSIVLACRPRPATAPLATRGEFLGALRAELGPAVRLLQQENIAPVDLAQSAIGPGMAIFSRYAKVLEADGSAMTVRTALALINEVLGEVLSGEEAEFDANTRFALTWFEQYGHNPGPFGDADVLARAKDTTVAGVVEGGIAASRDGKVRLLERDELPTDWDPTADGRLTVWETTQHLIRALSEESERDAAALLARIGPGFGERARQLAYLLYQVCDRRKWADEAGAYNMLVTAWPELARLAATGPTGADQLF